VLWSDHGVCLLTFLFSEPRDYEIMLCAGTDKAKETVSNFICDVSVVMDTVFVASTVPSSEPCTSVSTVSDYGLDDRGSIRHRGGGYFLRSVLPDRLWGPPSLLYYGYRGLFVRG
jgi:hypothetical protein